MPWPLSGLGGCVDPGTLPLQPLLSQRKAAVRMAARSLQVPLLQQSNEKVGPDGMGTQDQISQDGVMRTPMLL